MDSTAVDAAGTVYQGFHDRSEVSIFSATGKHVRTVDIRHDGVTSVTNIAISPGSTTA